MHRLLLAVLLLVAALPLRADDTSALPGPVRQMVLAYDLYDLGVAREDVVLVLDAIALARASTMRPATGWAHDGAGTQAEPAAPDNGLPHDPLGSDAPALARMMAEGDPDLADLAADQESRLDSAGAARGLLSMAEMTLPAGKSDTWKIAFNGQLPAEVAVLGNDRAFSLTVEDAAASAICHDGPDLRAYCAFIPERNDFFTLRVTNTGPATARYRLVTN
jgi:hypothetical protein